MTNVAVGVVRSFDEDRAIGLIDLDDGSTLDFHSTALSDRSRQVAVGQRVSVAFAATHGGRREAVEVIKLEITSLERH